MDEANETVKLQSETIIADTKLKTVRELFTESWLSLKQNFVRLFLFVALAIGSVLIWLIGAVVIVLVGLGFSLSNLGGIANFDWQEYLFSLQPAQIIIPSVIFIVWTILFAIFSAAISYGQILFVGDDAKQGLWTYVKKGLGMIVPMLVVEMMASLIIFGNFLLLVIPAIIASVYLSLVSFEVLLNNKRGMNALKGSASIINQHFGYLLVKVLAIFGVQILFQVGTYLLKEGGESLTIILNIYNIVGGFFINWFSMIYGIQLYKEVRDKTDWNKPANISWMWITSLLGFVLFILLVIGSFSILSKIQSNYGIDSIYDKSAPIELPRTVQEN